MYNSLWLHDFSREVPFETEHTRRPAHCKFRFQLRSRLLFLLDPHISLFSSQLHSHTTHSLFHLADRTGNRTKWKDAGRSVSLIAIRRADLEVEPQWRRSREGEEAEWYRCRRRRRRAPATSRCEICDLRIRIQTVIASMIRKKASMCRSSYGAGEFDSL